MEHESFEDKEVAEYLNAHFISIKVDKEERPDIDAVYMNVCQTLTGSGGWPLTILMSPEQKPFYAGTYFPKHRRFGHPGLLELLESVSKKWSSDRDRLIAAGEEITALFTRTSLPVSSEQQQDDVHIKQAVQTFKSTFDRQYGGFGAAPKFPTPHNLMFLLRYHVLENDQSALEMVEKTLQQMYRGGIFDHIGYGFSRYSTDKQWLVPHFEKMLYDNALLAIILLETYQVTRNPLYKTVAEKTLDYIDREMTSPEGAFYSAQDADSEGEEGKYYTFTPAEVEQILGKDNGMHVCHHFGITQDGNFEGKSIPNLIHNTDYEHTDPVLDSALPKLRTYRSQRTTLHKDDKILTAWNALMIIALSKACRITGEECFMQRAVRALHFLQTNLVDQNNILHISFRDGKAKGKGVLDDHAFLVWAYLELYETTYQTEYLAQAIESAEDIIQRFADDAGGFFLNAKDGESLLFRPKEQYDGAIPSGNSVMAYCFTRLAALTGEQRWQQAADQQLAFYHDEFTELPYAHCFALMALMLTTYPTTEVVCVIQNDCKAPELIHALNSRFLPQTSILLKTEHNAKQLTQIAPFTQDYKQKDNRDTFFICRNKSCSPPLFSQEELIRSLEQSFLPSIQ